MVEYKSIHISSVSPIDIRSLEIVNRILSKQPKPHPYIDLDKKGFVFHFHTLDLSLLENEIQAMSKSPDKSGVSEYEQAKEILRGISIEINKIGSYGIKSGKRHYIDFDSERKVKNRREKEEKRLQYYYARDNDFSKQDTPLPAELTNRIICGDSLRVLQTFPENCIDLILTSPPYNFGLEYEGQDDAHFWEHYFEKLFRIFDECIRVLKYGGRIVVNIQPLFSDYIPSHHIVSNYFMSKKMIWKGEILWEKNNYNCKYTAWGSWKSPSSPYLKYTWEFLEVFAKGTLIKAGNVADADITADEFKKWVVAKWHIAPERRMKEFGHPAMFPEELATRVIKLFSFVGDVVLDPFNGVGTTTAVAQKLGRRFVGIDISEEYCETARKRIQMTLF